MVVLENDSLWAWGNNEYGQLGIETKTDSSGPVQILTNVASVSVGQYHTIAVKHNGSLWAWGDNYNGQLGDGTRYTSTTSPVQVLSDTGTGYFYLWGGDFSYSKELTYMALSSAAYLTFEGTDISMPFAKTLSEIIGKRNPEPEFMTLPNGQVISQEMFITAVAGDWKLMDYHFDPSNGFYGIAVLSPNNDEVVVSCRGTDGSWAHFKADAGMSGVIFKSSLFSQIEAAKSFYRNAIFKAKHQFYAENCVVVATGHSLGGALAASLGYLFDIKVRTFNAPSCTYLLFGRVEK